MIADYLIMPHSFGFTIDMLIGELPALRTAMRLKGGTVAAALGVSESTARQRYARVVERAQLRMVGVLAERIDGHGEDTALPHAA